MLLARFLHPVNEFEKFSVQHLKLDVFNEKSRQRTENLTSGRSLKHVCAEAFYHCNLTEDFFSLQDELEVIESRLLDKEDLLLHEKERLEEEMRLKEQQIQEWEHEFHQKEMEFLTKEEFIKEQYSKNLLETRSDLENQYSASMQQLRTELDEDYQQQLRRLETSLNDHYGAEIGQLNSRHQEQVLWWNVLLVVSYRVYVPK